MYTECLPFTPLTPQHALSDDAACGYSGLGTTAYEPRPPWARKTMFVHAKQQTVPLLDSFQNLLDSLVAAVESLVVVNLAVENQVVSSSFPDHVH